MDTKDKAKTLLDLWNALSDEEKEDWRRKGKPFADAIVRDLRPEAAQEMDALPLGYYEVLDRTSMALEHFAENVKAHPTVEEDEELLKQCEVVLNELHALYQIAGAKWYHATKDNPTIWHRRGWRGDQSDKEEE